MYTEYSKNVPTDQTTSPACRQAAPLHAEASLAHSGHRWLVWLAGALMDDYGPRGLVAIGIGRIVSFAVSSLFLTI